MKKHRIRWFFFLASILFWSGNLHAQVPSITSFTPASAPTGTPITITGTNFSSTAANNIVFFGAVRAQVTAASSTSLTVTVLTGATYTPITVTANNLTAYSNGRFVVTFPTSGIITSSSMATKVDFPSGVGSTSVAIGDLDGDGKPDLVVANFDSGGGNTISVFRNTSASGGLSLAAKFDLDAFGAPYSVAIGDLDGDGKPDIAVANSNSNSISVFRNTSTSGNITFAAAVNFGTGNIPYNVAIGDLDGDGKPELVTTNFQSTVSVLRNTSTVGSITSSSFAGKVDYVTGGTSSSGLALGDIDGDGKLDLVVANTNSNTISVLRNTSAAGSITSSSFATKIDFATGISPYYLALGDLDGDGKLDIVVPNSGSNTVSVYRNISTTGSISLVAKVDFPVLSNPYNVEIGDLDGDGKVDCVIGNALYTTASVLRNISTTGSITSSSFADRVDFLTLASYSQAVGDLDGDGKPDLVIANFSNPGSISVLRNRVSGPTAIAVTAGNNQSGTINTVLSNPFVVTVTDSVGNPVRAASVLFAIASVPSGATGQSLSATNTTTGVNGQTATTLTLGNKIGTYTVTATSTGLTGSPVTFTATATPGPATAIALTSGNNQSGTINSALANSFVVTVTDVAGNPVQGTNVIYAIAISPTNATGQSLSVTSTMTNANGQASTTLTLGNKIGVYTVGAISAGLVGSPVSFTATATAGPATVITLTSGNNQSGIISTTLANPFVVAVTDVGGNPVQGTSVTLAIATAPASATGQGLSTTSTTTNVNGQASTVLTLGNKIGSFTVMAVSLGLTGSPVTFTATATVGPAAIITLTSGNNQSGIFSTALANPFVVAVTDVGGNPVQGASVVFAIASVTSGATGQSLSVTAATTNASGQASTVLTLGNKVGTYTVTATSTGLTGSPVTFTATATPGPATAIALTSGNNQSGTINSTLANSFVVTVTDVAGNPVQGTNVVFAIASIPSGATGQSLSATTTTTNASGQASSILSLGSKAGTYGVTTTAQGLSGSPVTFTATATAGAAATIALTSGNNQSGTISSVLANPFVVTVTDAGGNPIQGTSVTFAISSLPTGATGQSLSVTNASTNVNGQASSVLTLGNKVGTYPVIITSTGLTGSPVTFTATATAGPATAIAVTSGNNQSGIFSTALANPFVVAVTDVGGNPVQGTSVTFAITSTPAGATGQSLSTTTATTNASGQASSILSLGSKTGTYGVTATAQGLSGSPIVFSAMANNPVPTITIISINRAGRGSQLNETITGTNFLAGITTVTFGADITINSQSVTSATQILANITISSTAATGGRDVSVTNASPGGGTATLSNGFTIDTSPPTSVDNFSNISPREYALQEAYPNPFNPSTTIQFSLPQSGYVMLKVYDIFGKEVATLIDENLSAGRYATKWNAAEFASGVYFYRLQALSFVETKKLLLMK